MENDAPNKLPGASEALLIEGSKEQSERRQHEDAKTDKQQRRDQLKFNRLLTWFTGGLLVFTFVGNGIAIWQASIASEAASAAKNAAQIAKETLESSNETSTQVLEQMGVQSKAMQNAATAATIQAGTSKAAIATTVEQFQAEQRAWVIAAQPTLNADRNGVVWHIINWGKSPALRIVSNANVVIDQSKISQTQEQICRDISAPDYFREILIPYQVGRPRTAFADDGATSYLVGCIKYADQFRADHWTKFCYEPYVRTPGTFIACFSHNSTDADQVEGSTN